MGNSTSSELAEEEAKKVKEAIARKCDCYVISIEHTNSVVDVKLNGLRKEISDLVDPLREMPCVQELGLLGMSAILEDVENFANEHKFLIKRMLDIMFQTQNEFEEMCQRHMNETSTEEAQDDEMLDEDCMAEMRAAIENIVRGYETELDSMGIPLSYQAKRGDELRRLLFKLAESTVSETVEGFVQELKEYAMEEIDNDLCLGMMSGQFTDATAAKEALRRIISKSIIARASLEALPFSRRIDIEAAQDEVALHVDQLVRRIQMNHVHSAEELVSVMNIDMYDSNDDQSANSASESDSEAESEEGSDENSEEEVVVAPVRGKGRGRGQVSTSSKSTTKKSKQPAPSSSSSENDSEEGSSEEEDVPASTSKRGTKRKAPSTRAAKTAPPSAAKRPRARQTKQTIPKTTPSKSPAGRGKRQPKPKKLE